MKERSISYIKVYRRGNEYVRIPITPACIVKYTLMKEYYVRLSYVSDKPISFQVGDYINDEIFGLFYITDEQTPNDNGGVYQYELNFNAPCYRWKNRKMMMISSLPTGESFRKETVWSLTGTLEQLATVLSENVRLCGFGNYDVKIEDFIKTKAVECHCISFNGTDIITALNTFCSADNWNCEWWVEENEHTVGGTSYVGTLHLGKCDLSITESMEEYNFTNERLQSMSVNRSQTSFFNKLYCFGSTNNIPLTYRKELRLTLTDFDNDCFIPDKKLDATFFKDVKKVQVIDISKIRFSTQRNTARVVSDNYGTAYAPFTIEEDREFEYQGGYSSDMYDSWWNAETWGYYGDTEAFTLNDVSTVNINIPAVEFLPKAHKDYTNGNIFAFAMKLDMYLRNENMTYDEPLANKTFYWNDGFDAGFNSTLETNGKIITDAIQDTKTLQEGKYHIFVSYKIVLLPFREAQDEGENNGIKYPDFILGSELTYGADMWSLTVKTEETRITDTIGRSPILTATYSIGGVEKTCLIRFNPKNLSEGKYPSAKYGFMCVDAEDNEKHYVNDDFTTQEDVEGKTNTIVISDNDSINIPTSYYTNIYDNPFSLAQLGDRRLLLPQEERELGDGYILKDGYIVAKDIKEEDIIEEAVVFDNVYPKSTLIVSDIGTRRKRTVETYETDGSQDIWDWLEYAVTFKFSDTKEPFVFDKNYILPGETLKVRFMTPNDIGLQGLPTDGFMLAGMTFEAEYYKDKDNSHDGNYPENSFALVQNKDFGALLPSDTSLHPQVGDAAEVLGWNIKAMTQLGLIAKAENELLEKGLEYIKAVNDNNVTAECVPTAKYLFDLQGYKHFFDANNSQFYTSNGQPFLVRNLNEYELLDIGAPVNVHSDLFKGGVFKSRVIGFEYKLDKPYDNPRYTIGETEAYSRLRQIEKNITKLS